MKNPLAPSQDKIETEAEDHAEETRRAVTQRECRPQQVSPASLPPEQKPQTAPWQVD